MRPVGWGECNEPQHLEATVNDVGVRCFPQPTINDNGAQMNAASTGQCGGWNVFLHDQLGGTETNPVGGLCRSASDCIAGGQDKVSVPYRRDGDFAGSPSCAVDAADGRLRLPDALDADQGGFLA